MPLVFEEAASVTVGDLLRRDDDMAVWWGTWVECAVAISRLRREGRLEDEAEEETRVAFDQLAEDWTEVRPTEDVRLLASLISKDHPLKTADTLQLAAALRWCEGDTNGVGFVCLDDRLRRTAQNEGFGVLPEPNEEAR